MPFHVEKYKSAEARLQLAARGQDAFTTGQRRINRGWCASRDPLSAQPRPVRPDSRSVCAARRASAVILSSGINYSLHYQYHSGRMDRAPKHGAEGMNLSVCVCQPAGRLSCWNDAKYLRLWWSNYRMGRMKVRMNALVLRLVAVLGAEMGCVLNFNSREGVNIRCLYYLNARAINLWLIYWKTLHLTDNVTIHPALIKKYIKYYFYLKKNDTRKIMKIGGAFSSGHWLIKQVLVI